MEKYCPSCRTLISDPGTSDMLKYAKFWRDNKCYICDTALIIPKSSQPTSLSTTPSETTYQTPNKKRIRWGWIVFAVVIIFIIYLISTIEDLKVAVNTLKNDDSSVLWITNEESIPIKLLELEINGDYILKDFPDSDDTYMNEYLIGRGKKYIHPEEKIMIFTKYFYDSDGKKFDSYNTVFTKIKVSAEVGNDLRFFIGKP